GLGGVARHYYQYSAFNFMSGFSELSIFITISAIMGFLTQFIFLGNFFYSIFRGKKASANPWKSNTLEWTTPVDPGHGNWPGEIPTVYRWPYDYSKPGVKDDYLPQHIPDEEIEYEEGYPRPATIPQREAPIRVEEVEERKEE
ncbi:MAG: cytochrome c oxidase subunit I, partial [Bacteroidota bacterium]